MTTNGKKIRKKRRALWKLFLLEEHDTPIKMESLIEAVTGLRPLTAKEQRTLQIYGEAIHVLWAAHKIEIDEERQIVPGIELGHDPLAIG